MVADSAEAKVPAEVCDSVMRRGIMKARLPLVKMLLLAILAGMLVALGAAAANVAMHDIDNVGIMRLVAGIVFPTGLIMTEIVSGELFTSNTLMVTALVNREISLLSMLRNWIIVFLGNLIGALTVVGIVSLTGQLGLTAGQMGAFTIKVALDKVALTPANAFFSGVLCNILLACSVIMATRAKETSGRMLAIFVPGFAFMVCGFEHSISNMYYIPAGMLAALNPSASLAAANCYGVTTSELAGLSLGGFLANLSMVTLGNIVGGALIALIFWAVCRSKTCNPAEERR